MARNPTQHPDIVEIGVAVSRAISYGTQGSPTVMRGRSAPQVRLHLRSDAANPKLTVQVVRIGLAAGDMRVEWRMASPEPAGGYSRQPEPVQGAFGVTV